MKAQPLKINKIEMLELPPYTPPSKGQTYECLRGDNHLEIYLRVRNAGTMSCVSISWNAHRHPEIEQFGRAVVEDALASFPEDLTKLCRLTTMTYGVASWSIFFVPAVLALDIAGKIFPTMIELWNAWSRAVSAHPNNIDMQVTSIVRTPPVPEWLKPSVNATNEAG